MLDPHTLRIRLSAPYAPLLALLANRSGTMLSPRILDKPPEAIAAHPVCAGPFAFKERVAQDHITLERFAGYWNAKAVSLDRIVFQVITDPSVRLANLQSGTLDIANRLAATDIGTVVQDKRLRLAQSRSIGFEMLSLNVAHGPAANTPFGHDPRVREAFEKAIDRAALNQVVFDGHFIPSDQTEAPGSRYWDPAHPVPARDLAGAKALLAAAGQKRVKLTLLVSNDAVDVQVGEVIQAMTAEAGFDVSVQKSESVAQVQTARSGNYQASLVLWSGASGSGRQYQHLDALRRAAELDRRVRQVPGRCADSVARRRLMRPAAPPPTTRRTISDEGPAVHRAVPFQLVLGGLSSKVSGFAPRPDGLFRPIGLTVQP